ncbi:MAG TPA: TrmH family RNA methyltransferase [Chloroflexota bacterium]
MRKLTTEELRARKPHPDTFHQQPRFPISILLNNVRSLENVGLVFRLCDAIRAHSLHLCGITGFPPLPEGDPRYPWVAARAGRGIAKTAIQTVEHVPWEYHSSAVEAVRELRRRRVQIVAVEQTASSIPYTEAPYRFPVCLVLGHERDGIEEGVLDEADLVVEIPMHGLGNSLNVATAAAVVAYHLLERMPRRSGRR